MAQGLEDCLAEHLASALEHLVAPPRAVRGLQEPPLCDDIRVLRRIGDDLVDGIAAEALRAQGQIAAPVSTSGGRPTLTRKAPGRMAAISSCRRLHWPVRAYSRVMTMSISAAPSSTA